MTVQPSNEDLQRLKEAQTVMVPAQTEEIIVRKAKKDRKLAKCKKPGRGASKEELNTIHQAKMARKAVRRTQFYNEMRYA